MRFQLVLPFLATAATATSNLAQPDYYGTLNEKRYPLCPETYDTYCCLTVVPYTNHCSRGRCKQENGWSCPMGRGKVASIRTCLEEDESGRLSAYCKRPGVQYFPSIMSWEGGSFRPVLEPSDYRHWVKPGMHKPWIPSSDEIRWEEEAEESNNAGTEELRKRYTVQDSNLD